LAFFSIPSNEGTELKLQCLWDSTQPYPTNNKAELEAVCTAIKVAEQQGISRLKVLTDSTYVEGCVNTWRRGWEASRRWTTSNGQPVRNRHLIEHLYQLVDQDHLSVRIEFSRRDRSMGNILADSLARTGAALWRSELWCDLCRVHKHATHACRKLRSNSSSQCAVCRRRSHATAGCWFLTADQFPAWLLHCKSCGKKDQHPTFKCSSRGPAADSVLDRLHKLSLF